MSTASSEYHDAKELKDDPVKPRKSSDSSVTIHETIVVPSEPKPKLPPIKVIQVHDLTERPVLKEPEIKIVTAQLQERALADQQVKPDALESIDEVDHPGKRLEKRVESSSSSSSSSSSDQEDTKTEIVVLDVQLNEIQAKELRENAAEIQQKTPSSSSRSTDKNTQVVAIEQDAISIEIRENPAEKIPESEAETRLHLERKYSTSSSSSSSNDEEKMTFNEAFNREPLNIKIPENSDDKTREKEGVTTIEIMTEKPRLERVDSETSSSSEDSEEVKGEFVHIIETFGEENPVKLDEKLPSTWMESKATMTSSEDEEVGGVDSFNATGAVEIIDSDTDLLDHVHMLEAKAERARIESSSSSSSSESLARAVMARVSTSSSDYEPKPMRKMSVSSDSEQVERPTHIATRPQIQQFSLDLSPEPVHETSSNSSSSSSSEEDAIRDDLKVSPASVDSAFLRRLNHDYKPVYAVRKMNSMTQTDISATSFDQ